MESTEETMPLTKKKVNKEKKKSTNSNCDNERVKRIYSPFNRFANNFTRTADQKRINRMPYQSSSPSAGLSPKEKSYVICSCQSRSVRYAKLKNMVANAVTENKIFTIYGGGSAVRKALLDRGWVEKIPANKMNLSKLKNGTLSNQSEILSELERLLLSNLVEKHYPNFIWRTKNQHHDIPIDISKERITIENKLKIHAEWTTKQGLCSSMKRNYWFYIENKAEVNGPRSYNSYDTGEIDEFVKDYRITACTSLLKWVLSMVANERPVFLDSGKISINVFIFALNRCKEYLFRKQNKDIDRHLGGASLGQWNAFLEKYYRIIAKEEIFQTDSENKLPLYLVYAKFLLKKIHKYRPQLSCEGCHNIWIIKPAYCSRGRGIRLASKLGVITNLLNKANSKYVVQKYIEEPLLIHETKFDIRQYYLVTSTYPLVIWMYRDCYLKFSSQKYNLNNYHESIHLTNNAVQRRYKNCVGRHSELPKSNMWDLDKYKDYLNRYGRTKVWDNIIYPGMKKSIIGIMLSCQDSLSVSKGRFELYGCDFILDKEYKPWLIEINAGPDLNHTTQVTAKICPAVCSDIIKVVIDHARNPKSATGKFECIYRQPMTIPRFSRAADLFVRGYSLPLDYFYRGNIEIKESYNDADIGEEGDIKAILDKLKDCHDIEDIMVNPEEDCENEHTYEARTYSTESENELSEDAAVITGQLDELMSRIPSKYSCCSKSLTNPFKDSLQRATSETPIESFLKKSYTRFISTIDIRKSFRFRNFDDGLFGKRSSLELASMKRKNMSSSAARDKLSKSNECKFETAEIGINSVSNTEIGINSNFCVRDSILQNLQARGKLSKSKCELETTEIGINAVSNTEIGINSKSNLKILQARDKLSKSDECELESTEIGINSDSLLRNLILQILRY